MNTTIPHTEFSRIIQTKSSPETIAALLNEAERTFSSSQKTLHWNAKRVYPFWKTCKVCSNLFETHNRTQALRNVTCSNQCAVKSMTSQKVKKPMERRKMTLTTCPQCGKKTWMANSRIKRNKASYCSKACRAKHATAPILVRNKFDRTGMTFPGTGQKGDKNSAWKGGVTYFKRKGKYANQSIKYIRCPIAFLAMARKDGYVMEHRIVVAIAIGRLLTRKECVHHINHDATDNRLENLMLFATNSDHKRYEHHGIPDPIWRGSNLSITLEKFGVSEFLPAHSSHVVMGKCS